MKIISRSSEGLWVNEIAYVVHVRVCMARGGVLSTVLFPASSTGLPSYILGENKVHQNDQYEAFSF